MTGVVAVVQARMGSSRLPGKVLMDIGGRPLLEFMLGRLASASIDRLVVATTHNSDDDPIADLVGRLGLDLVRGPESDVLARYALAVERFPADYVVRLTADCPLSDPRIVNAAIKVAVQQRADYTSNTIIRTYPDGLDVEVCKSSALLEAARTASDPEEREHVTPHIYRRPDRFDIAVLRQDEDFSFERWTVDYPEDLARVKKVVADLGGRDDFTWKEAISVAGSSRARESGVYLRTAGPQDISLVRSLLQTPDNVRLSGIEEPVGSNGFVHDYTTLLTDVRHRVWICETNGARVGVIRLDIEEGIAALSIYRDASSQDDEVDTPLVRSLQRAMASDYQIQELRARVRDDGSSPRVFETNGFRRIGQEDGVVTLGWGNRSR